MPTDALLSTSLVTKEFDSLEELCLSFGDCVFNFIYKIIKLSVAYALRFLEPLKIQLPTSYISLPDIISQITVTSK